MIILLGLAPGSLARGQDVPSAKAYRDFAVRRDGNIDRGRSLFFAPATACAQCHSIDGSADKAGPDLFAVGDKFPRRELIGAILEPSTTIAVGYGATLVEMKSGDTFYGVIKQSDAVATTLMGADGKPVPLRTQDIKCSKRANWRPCWWSGARHRTVERTRASHRAGF